MSSIFDLKTDTSELSSANQGISNMEYAQHPPTRSVADGNFPNGAIHFRFQNSGEKWWVPSRSYLRMRCKITDGAGAQLDIEKDVAANMGLMANLFQSAEMRINDKVVSRVADYMPQVDALEHRLTKSKSWLDSVGKSTNFWDESYLGRQNDVCSDGTRLTTDTNEKIETSTELKYDGAGGNTMKLTFGGDTNRIEIEKGGGEGGGPDLPINVWKVGDFVEMTSNAGGLEGVRYQVNNVINGASVDAQRLTIVPYDRMPAAELEVFTNFNRVRGQRQNDARRVKDVELTWCPTVLSLFKVGHAMPSGRYELVLNPQTSSAYQKRAIQSLTSDKVSGTDFKFEIVDLYLYCATVEGPRVRDLTYLLDLSQTRCQAEKISGPAFSQKNLDVSPSTTALTVAYQDLRAGTDTRCSASQFKSYEAGVAESPLVSNELNLNRLFINYAGVNKPSPDADPSFDTAVDNTTQRYTESQIGSGAMFDTGGAETIQDYHNRGSYYYFPFPKDGTDRSTRVNVHQGFEAGTDITNMRMLLFDHSKQVARVRIQDSQVVDVQVEDV